MTGRWPAYLVGLALLCGRIPLCGQALVDGGSWRTQRGYSPAEGALSLETAAAGIALEKELLELRDIRQGSTRAVYLLHNTGTDSAMIECAFPLRFDFAARRITLDGKGGFAGAEATRETAAGDIAAWDFGDVVAEGNVVDREASLRDQGFVNDVLSAASVITDPWDTQTIPADAASRDSYAGLWFADARYPRGTKELDPAPLRKLLRFRIVQDGKEVPVSACTADFGEQPGRIALRFRFPLSFAPDGRSTVTITCAMPTRSSVSGNADAPGAPMVSTFTWRYMMGTASGWTDPPARILLSVPVGARQEPGEPWRYIGAARGRQFFSAGGAGPTSDQDLTFTWESTSADYPNVWRTLTEPLDPARIPTVESPARLIDASSYLHEAADVFLPQGIWHNAPFDPARLFDGLPETAWAVRTPRGGTGEWVRFALDAPVERLEIANGYQRSTADFPDKSTWSYFGKNNRVKTLDIVRDDTGRIVQRLQLADTREIQRFDVNLGPGTYRAVISDIYRGTRWNDTCLGEITFVPGTTAGFAEVSTDDFFAPLTAPAVPPQVTP